jgi:hypothetical protein
MEIANIIDTTPTTLLVWDSSSAIASIVWGNEARYTRIEKL